MDTGVSTASSQGEGTSGDVPTPTTSIVNETTMEGESRLSSQDEMAIAAALKNGTDEETSSASSQEAPRASSQEASKAACKEAAGAGSQEAAASSSLEASEDSSQGGSGDSSKEAESDEEMPGESEQDVEMKKLVARESSQELETPGTDSVSELVSGGQDETLRDSRPPGGGNKDTETKNGTGTKIEIAITVLGALGIGAGSE